eukprot:2213863-Rhodomonas_salina.1
MGERWMTHSVGVEGVRPTIVLVAMMTFFAAAAVPAPQTDDGRPAADPFAVLAYLPEWRYEGANWDTMCQHVSHLILFSLEVKPNGELGALDRIPRPALMAEAQAAATKHNTALLICFGGNGRSNGFSPMVASKKARKRFLKELKALMK